MQPVVSPEEMAVIDAEAPEPVEELIERAGWAIYRAALELLGGADSSTGSTSAYGKRVLVLAGKGNNGADGRSAARFLRRRGVSCQVVDVSADGFDAAVLGSRRVAEADLIIDAGVGTGLTRRFDRFDDLDPGDTPVLAVDIPSGVDGMTGEIRGSALAATLTVTFATLKPGLLLEPGRSLCGRIEVVDIGLDCGRARMWHAGLDDVRDESGWPQRDVDSHKWRTSVLVIGGNHEMVGAPTLSAIGALRAGAGAVSIAVPGLDLHVRSVGPPEVIQVDAGSDWGRSIDLDRYRSVVVGPGLSLGDEQAEELNALLDRLRVPVVIDAGALRLVARRLPLNQDLNRGIDRDLDRLPILTPHDGEFEAVFGRSPGGDRVAEVRSAARQANAVVLLKGPTTIVAHPDGRVGFSTAGDQRLATAGSGDVLSGIIAAGSAGGLDSFSAALLGTELHAQAGLLGPAIGLIPTELADNLPAVLTT